MRIALTLLVLIFSQMACATKPIPPKKNGTISYQNLVCKQKVLPVKTDYSLDGNIASIKITAEKDIASFKLTAVRGVDGLKVDTTTALELQDLSQGDVFKFDVTFTKPVGLSYLVADIEGKVNGQLKKQSLPIPVGKISNAQRNMREKNIKKLPSLKKKESSTEVEATEETFNVAPLESN